MRVRDLSVPGIRRLVIFSNQNGIGKQIVEGKRSISTRGRIDNFIRDVGVPMEAYCATQKDDFRKPRDGMWRYLNDNVSVDCAKPDVGESFFVGDAAGALFDRCML